MDHTTSTAELRIRIAKYRAIARLTTDQETAQRIQELADELETRVREIQDLEAKSPSGPN